MANTIQVRRGANASLPTLNAGEFGFSTDTKQLYIGDGATNYELTGIISDHGALAGLTDDDHSQYSFLNGRSGGQVLIGGTASGDDLTLQSTSNATKGSILFGTSAYDEVNNRLGIGTTSPGSPLEVNGNAKGTIFFYQDALTNNNMMFQGGIAQNAAPMFAIQRYSSIDTRFLFRSHVATVTSSRHVKLAMGDVDGTAPYNANVYFEFYGSSMRLVGTTQIIVAPGETPVFSFDSNATTIASRPTTNADIKFLPDGTGQVIVQPETDSTTFFQVLDADGGTPILNVDTTNERVGIGNATPDTALDIAGAFTLRELSADPSDPDEGSAALWMSDGTGSGDDGDILMKITAGGSTKTVTIVDFSAA